MSWATRHRLLPSAAASSVFAAGRFAHLMGRAYPRASHADLCLAVAWLAFTFNLDDRLETEFGRAPTRQRTLAEAMIAYLRAPHEETQASLTGHLGAPLAGALVDVWTRTTQRSSPRWRTRFVRHVEQYLAANAWEAENRCAGRIPSVEAYVHLRRHTAATAMFFDLIEVFGDFELPAETLTDPTVVRLRRSADSVVAWFNDLVSWRKELTDGDPHNLVLVLRHDRQLSLSQAQRQVVEWHDAEMRQFVAAHRRLRDNASPELHRLLDGLTYWVRANVDWSAESGRYASP